MKQVDWRADIAELEAGGHFDEILPRLELLGFDHPDDPELGYEIGERYRAAGRCCKAALVFALVAEVSGSTHRLRALLAQAECLGELGEFERALAVVREAQRHEPGSHLPLVYRHTLEGKAGKTVEWDEIARPAFKSLHPACRAELLRHIAQHIAFCHFEATRPMPSWRAKVAGPVSPLAQAGLLMMVKDEADIIYQNLVHHHRIGFRNFCILNNGSTDQTEPMIRRFQEEFPDALLLLVNDPIVGYYQSEKMDIFHQAFLRYARLAYRTLDWLFFVDADEFIAYFEGDPAHGVAELERVLADPRHDLLILHWVHAAPSQILQSLPADYAPLDLFDRVTTQLLPAVPKIAFRPDRGLKPRMGNHFVEFFDGPYDGAVNLACIGWYMLHAQLRSIDQVRSKIINGGRAFQNAPGLETHGNHWRERYLLYLQHGEAIVPQVLNNYVNSIN